MKVKLSISVNQELLSNPAYRVGVGAGNDVLFSMIAGEEGVLKTIKRKFTGKKR